MINKLAGWITRHPKIVLLIAVLLIIPSAIGYFTTKVNYDILSYLPEDVESVQGEEILDKTFGEASMSFVIMRDLTWDAMEQLETDISGVEHVGNVLWLGALTDSPIPRDILPSAVSEMLYSADGESTLMLVQYTTKDTEELLDAVGEIKHFLNKDIMMSGISAVTYDLMDLTNQEAPKYIAIAIALALVALMFTMESFLLPFVLLAALGLAVIYNMGTNFVQGSISFVTQAIAAILQLAVTMDYSVFLMDRYAEEKPRYATREAAMQKAIVGTFTSLAGSSLTTIFGFLALCFMQLTLGADIGLVMAKGVVLGVVTVVVVLPAMLLLTEKAILKTRKKSLIPPFHALNKGTLKARKVLALVFVGVAVVSFVLQKNVKKYYNMMLAVPEGLESIEALDVMKSDFNMASTHFIVVDADLSPADKVGMVNELQSVEGVSGALSLESVLGTAISPSILPEQVARYFIADGKELLMVNSVYDAASDESNAQVETIKSIIKSYDPGAILTGEAAMYKDLIAITDRDFVVTNIISIAAIFLLVALIFKSISIPAILVLSIECAIWINLAICTLQGEVINFVTPTIISAVQLGATVDYAILLTTRYQEELRRGKGKLEAMQIAADQSHRSIFQSALVFFAACFGVYLVCDIDIVRSICAMLARGAAISALTIIVFLTPILPVCEGLIERTSYHWRLVQDPTSTLASRLEQTLLRNEELKKLAYRLRYDKKASRAEKKGKSAPERWLQNKLDKTSARTQKKLEKHRAIPVKADYVSGTITSLEEAQAATALIRQREADERTKTSEEETQDE